MQKNSKVVLLLLSITLVHTALHGIWWVSSVQEIKKELQDYAGQYGSYLRHNNKVFPRVPSAGNIQWYHLLGVEKDADEESIKKAWKKLVLATHPDKGTDNAELFKAVNAALEEYKTLLSSQKYQVVWSGTFKSRYGNFDQSGKNEPVFRINSLAEFFLLGEEREKASQVDEATFAQEFQKLTKDWKRFYLLKFALIGGLMASYQYLKKLSESDKDSWIKNKMVQKFIAWWPNFKKKHSSTATTLKACGRGSFIMLAGMYPLYRFRKFFEWGALNAHYRSETMRDHRISDDDLKLFYKEVKVAERTIRYRNGSSTTIPIYEPSSPIGYMDAEQERKMFMPIRKAQVMEALTVVDSLVTTWMGFLL